MSRIEAPKGTLDVLPDAHPARDDVLRVATTAARLYGYRPVTIPTFEDTELFARTSGAGSDVVQKEMYTFTDRGERSLTLRPEATAGICRAYLEHGLSRAAQPVKVFTAGPMFRYAAPQKGRYREFWQLDYEAIGSAEPAVDAELIQLFHEILRRLGIRGVRLELNSIGDAACRPAYVERLRAFLSEHEAELDEDARAKAATSPLRVFDTKNPGVARVLEAAPTIGESLCDDCRAHFAEVTARLDAYGIEYVLVPTLVRGLDYYTRTVWEFVNDAIGAAQATICAGGRYDGLVEAIGGPPTPGVGFAAGIERIELSLAERPEPAGMDVFVAVDPASPEAARVAAAGLVADLRALGVAAETDLAGRSLKGQLTQAQRLDAATVVVLEGAEAVLRRRGREDERVPLDAVLARVTA